MNSNSIATLLTILGAAQGLRCSGHARKGDITTTTTTTSSPQELSQTECVSTYRGQEYKGTVSHTKSGRQCQTWSEDYSPQHMTVFDGKAFSDGSHAAAKNFCRNPSNFDGGLWCYTKDPDVRWESCYAPTCGGQSKNDEIADGHGCQSTQLGKEYTGSISHTKAGILCQRWDTNNSPQKFQDLKNSDFLEATVSDAANFCRNPESQEGRGGPWCYTVDPAVRWQYCNVPTC